ncbi:hypothetical protein Y032_0189g1199 [Ancylostoma ceylanicum]|uniref:Uncharacterized protein n=1 Tax=Ancylostoma ceylanicum TaxID=53326 RepID=A0A016SQI4_9BILA|nr:hypothetical protein Y032_0189g1199 [Ancylostoma ceylanicum]
MTPQITQAQWHTQVAFTYWDPPTPRNVSSWTRKTLHQDRGLFASYSKVSSRGGSAVVRDKSSDHSGIPGVTSLPHYVRKCPRWIPYYRGGSAVTLLPTVDSHMSHGGPAHSHGGSAVETIKTTSRTQTIPHVSTRTT